MRVNRQLRGLSLALGVLVVGALVAATLAVRQSHRADRSSLSADAGRVGARALVADDVTRSLLLAVAGARLDPSTEERRNLDAALGRYPELVRSASVPARSNLAGLEASPDGRTVAVVDDSHHLWSLDARTLRPLADVQVGDARRAAADTPLAFSPAGGVLAVGTPSSTRRSARLLDPRTLAPLRLQLAGWPTRPARVIGIRFSPDGRFLAVSLNQPADPHGGTAADHEPGARGVALVWDMAAPGRPLVDRVRLTADPYYSEVAPSSGGRTLYVAWPLSAYHLPRGSLEFRRPAASSIEVALDPTGHLLATPTFASPDQVLLADARTGRPVRRLRGHTGDVLQVSFSDDGSLLAATSRDGRVLVWDVATGNVVHDIAVGTQFATGVSFGPDARTLYTTAADSHEIHAWDLAGEHRFVARIPVRHPREVSSAFIRPSPDAGAVATMQNDGDAAPELRLVDLSTGRASRLSRRGPALRGRVPEAWRPDGARYAVAYGDGWVQVFAPGERRPIVQRHVLDTFWIERLHAGRIPARGRLGRRKGRLPRRDHTPAAGPAGATPGAGMGALGRS